MFPTGRYRRNLGARGATGSRSSSEGFQQRPAAKHQDYEQENQRSGYRLCAENGRAHPLSL